MIDSKLFMKKLLKFKGIVIFILPFIFIFISSIYIPRDPDLGWHLKYGEYFFQNLSILRENTFSTSMVDYKWPNSSWGVDLISFSAYKIGGFLGLSLLGATVVTLTFFVFSKLASLTFWHQALLFPILVYFETPVNSIAFRGQLLSMLFLGILFLILKKFQEGKQSLIYLLPLLFLFWTNIHGQYILGLILLIGWMFLYLVSNYSPSTFFQNLKIFAITFTFVVIATLINPFGFGVYQDAFSHFGNPNLQFITEYLPFDNLSIAWWHQIIIGMLLLFGVLFITFNNQLKNNFSLLGIVLLLYGMSFWVKRYAWSFYYLTLPLLKPIADFFKPETRKYQEIVGVVILISMLSLTIYFKAPISQYLEMNWESYCQSLGCSKGALEYLTENKEKLFPTKESERNLLTFYEWGGYMIFNYPEIKPSIDGRMHLWKEKSGYSAFEEYFSLEQDIEDIDTSSYNVVLMGPQKALYSRLLELSQEKKWYLVYQDNKSGIFVRAKYK